MQDLRDLYKAYSAVHDTTIKEELDNSKDQITGMDLSKMRDEDLIEVAEEIIEGLFQYGKTLDEAYEVVGAILEEASDNIIGDRKVKITRIAEAFDKAFDTVTDKAERNCEESFLKYRQTKPLTEKWHNKVSHEVGNAKVHASIIHEDRETMKTGLIEMISEKLDKVGQEDADIDNDGDVDSSDKYLHKRRKAIGKAMKKEEFVTELSKKTLGSYVKKAAGDAASRSFDHGESEKRQYEPDADDEKETNKLANRQKGIGRAVGKMMKKEETVLEGDRPFSSAGEYPMRDAMKAAGMNNAPVRPRPNSTSTPVKALKGGGMVKKDKKTKKESVFSDAELKAIEEKVKSWEEGYQRNPEKGEAEAKKSETSGQRAERRVRDRLKTMDPARAEAMKKQMRAVGLDV